MCRKAVVTGFICVISILGVVIANRNFEDRCRSERVKGNTCVVTKECQGKGMMKTLLTVTRPDGSSYTRWITQYTRCKGQSQSQKQKPKPKPKSKQRQKVVTTCEDKLSSTKCKEYADWGYCRHSWVTYTTKHCCKTCQDDAKQKRIDTTGGKKGWAGCLNSANYYRRKQRLTKDLTWDRGLALRAKRYAQVLLSSALRNKGAIKLIHDPNNKADKTGENLYGATTYRTVGDEVFCANADKPWYDEIADYDYSTARSKNGKMVGHFTQMVWRDTKRVGYGIVSAPFPGSDRKRIVFVVAKYSPPGNFHWRGHFLEDYSRNVQLPK